MVMMATIAGIKFGFLCRISIAAAIAFYGAALGCGMGPQWAGVGTWGHNPMPPWPQLAHQSWHATGGGN